MWSYYFLWNYTILILLKHFHIKTEQHIKITDTYFLRERNTKHASSETMALLLEYIDKFMQPEQKLWMTRISN